MIRSHYALCATAAVFAVLSNAHAQQPPAQLNVIRIEPVGEGKGKSLQLEGFYYVGSPQFSSDGERIAFDGYKGDEKNVTTECWIVNSDGSRAKRLARGATPRISPDGKQIAFMREEREDLGRPGGDDVGVFVIDVDGKNEKKLLDGRWPDWSPDGQKIAFSVGGRKQGGSRPGSRICIANSDGSNVEEVAIGDCPSWSPDGKKIACCFNDPAIGPPMIRVVDLASKEQTIVGFGWFRANWSADNESLYSNGIVNRRSGMVRLSTDKRGDGEPILTKFSGQSPCPSPDGKSIVFCTIEEEPKPMQ